MSEPDHNPWDECRNFLAQIVDAQTFDLHIKPALSVFDSETRVLWVGLPNPYSLDFFNDELGEHTKNFLNDRAIEVQFLVATLEELKRAAIGRPIDEYPHQSIVAEPFQGHLFSLERKGRIRIYPISAQNEFPKLLTRIPIFLPGHRAGQKKLLDDDFGLPFENAWAAGRKFGPPLSISDEDTLIALAQMRQTNLIAEPHKLPLPVSMKATQGDDSKTSVHTVICSVRELAKTCQDPHGGKSRKLRLDSLRRLAGTKIELVKDVGGGRSIGASFDLINVMWERLADEGTLYIQFSPVVTNWLKEEFTYIDPKIRFALSNDLSKALHRFLAGQRKDYSIGLKKLINVIGYARAPRRFVGDVRAAAQQLIDIGFLSNYEISGNGKGTPHILRIVR